MKKNGRDTIRKPAKVTSRSVPRTQAPKSSGNRGRAQKLRTAGRIVSYAADITDSVETLEKLYGDAVSLIHDAALGFETASEEVDDLVRLEDSLNQTAGHIDDARNDIDYYVRDIGRAFRKADGAFRKTLDTILDEEQADADSVKETSEIEKTSAQADGLLKSISDLTDRIDVAGVNASLEAGRAGENGGQLLVVAEGIQKAAAVFRQTAERFGSRTGDLKNRAGDVKKKRDRIAERLRTVTVLTRSIASALDETGVLLDDFNESADTLSLRTDETARPFGDTEPGVCYLSDELTQAAEEVKELSAVFEEAYGESEVSSSADILAKTAGTVSGDDADAVDALLTDIERFTEVAGDGRERIDEILTALNGLLTDTGNLESALDDSLGPLDETAASMAQTGKAAADLRKRLDEFRARLTDSRDVLKEMSREIDGLRREERTFSSALSALRDQARQMAGFEYDLADFCTRVDFLTVLGGQESLRTGKKGDAFMTHIRETESISSEAVVLKHEITDYTADFSGIIGALSEKTTAETWILAGASVRNLIGALDEILETGIGSVTDSLDIIDRFVKETSPVTESLVKQAAGIRKTAAEAVGTMKNAGDNLVRQIETHDCLSVTAGKMTGLVDELYAGNEAE